MMSQNRRLERIGILLAVLMSGAALGLEVQQRLASAPKPSPPSPPANATQPLHPTTTPDGEILPLPVPEDGKEILGKGKDLIRIQGVHSGRKQYELTAQRLVLTRDESKTAVEGIRGTLIGNDGKPAAAFTADRAVMHMQSKDLDVEGQVHVESLDREDKVIFSTRNMHWSARDERLTCPNPVEVTQPGVLLRGSSMVADARLRKLSLDGGVYLEADAEKVEKGLGMSDGSSSQSGGRARGAASSTSRRANGGG